MNKTALHSYINHLNYQVMGIVSALVFVLSLWSCETESIMNTANEMTEDESKSFVYEETPIADILAKNDIEIEQLSVFIDKSDYQLSIVNADTVVKTYPIVLGYNPVGDKMQEGDYKTPEGVFGIRDKYPHKAWEYFIWIDYPNEESWKRFKDRKADGIIGTDAKIGGEIGIHGTPMYGDYLIDEGENWTFGCVSLKISHIQEIYPLFHKDIKITIQA